MCRPLAGGTLARPYDRFPNVFGQRIWKEYPYLLPCLFSASVSALAFIAILGFLKEVCVIYRIGIRGVCDLRLSVIRP